MGYTRDKTEYVLAQSPMLFINHGSLANILPLFISLAPQTANSLTNKLKITSGCIFPLQKELCGEAGDAYATLLDLTLKFIKLIGLRPQWLVAQWLVELAIDRHLLRMADTIGERASNIKIERCEIFNNMLDLL